MFHKWKRRIWEGHLFFERHAHNARLLVRGRRQDGRYRWIVQHKDLVYFGWSKSLAQAMEDAEDRALVIDLKSRS